MFWYSLVVVLLTINVKFRIPGIVNMCLLVLYIYVSYFELCIGISIALLNRFFPLLVAYIFNRHFTIKSNFNSDLTQIVTLLNSGSAWLVGRAVASSIPTSNHQKKLIKNQPSYQRRGYKKRSTHVPFRVKSNHICNAKQPMT